VVRFLSSILKSLKKYFEKDGRRMKKGTIFCAYSFLYDDPEDLKTDYEFCTDEIASHIGLLKSYITDAGLKDELTKIATLVYHMNSSLRIKTAVTKDELNWLHERCLVYHEETNHNYLKFVLPQGTTAASHSHIIRSKCMQLARLMHRYEAKGNKIDPLLYDFANLLSDYFFLLALKLNASDNVEEIEFISRNYKFK